MRTPNLQPGNGSDHGSGVAVSRRFGSRCRLRGCAPACTDIEGRLVTEEAEGNGPVDATFNAIKALVPHEVVLELFQVHAVTEGTDAQAEVSVRLSENGKTVTAKGADPDTLVASAKAYLGALNRLMVKRLRTKPQPMTPDAADMQDMRRAERGP